MGKKRKIKPGNSGKLNWTPYSAWTGALKTPKKNEGKEWKIPKRKRRGSGKGKSRHFINTLVGLLPAPFNWARKSKNRSID